MTVRHPGDPRVPHVLAEISNPVTKSRLSLRPPVEISDAADLEHVITLIQDMCIRAWRETPRRDLREIRDVRGWMVRDAG